MQVERTTNHDVKAIEYVLKDKFRKHEELRKVRLALHWKHATKLSASSPSAKCMSALNVHMAPSHRFSGSCHGEDGKAACCQGCLRLAPSALLP